jgi:hypothetical protein
MVENRFDRQHGPLVRVVRKQVERGHRGFVVADHLADGPLQDVVLAEQQVNKFMPKRAVQLLVLVVRVAPQVDGDGGLLIGRFEYDFRIRFGFGRAEIDGDRPVVDSQQSREPRGMFLGERQGLALVHQFTILPG